MKEKDMYKNLLSCFKNNLIGKIYRIETGQITRSIPDCYFVTFSGKNGWIELKQTKQLANGTIKIPYRPGQQHWLTFHEHLKLNVYVLLRVGFDFYVITKNFSKSVFTDELDLVKDAIYIGRSLKHIEFTNLFV